VALTAVFVGLYTAALLGWIKPLTDNQVVTRLEAIIAVIIGYYFGRVPGEKNERTLKKQVDQETKKADAAEAKKEHAQKGMAEAEQKVRSVRAALSGAASAELVSEAVPGRNPPADDGGLRPTVAAALRVLDS